MSTLGTTILNHPFLSSMEPGDADHLLKNAKEMNFNPGDILFRAGDPANQFFLIQSGQVAVEKKTDETPIEIISAGNVLGWSWLFPPFSWHFQARALEPTEAIVLDGGHLLVTCEENHDFGYRLMRRISELVIHRLMSASRTI